MNERVVVEIDAETLKQAREAGVDLSAELTLALRRKLPPPPKSDAERRRAADRWYQENKEEIDYYNEYVAKHGLFSDGTRTF
jgi:post-segregation antitoxin (ccd killing protein)